MPKGDDYLQKKRTKAVRKRMRRVGADSLEAIQGVQAAKKRRQSGTRRACEGMCYTLPTPEDPFNERNDRRRRRQENRKLRTREVPEGEILEFEASPDVANGSGMDVNLRDEKQVIKKTKISEEGHEELQGRQKRRKVNQGSVKEETHAGKHDQNSDEKSSKLRPSQVSNLGLSSHGKNLEGVNGDHINEFISSFVLKATALRGNSLGGSVNGDSKKEKNGSVVQSPFRTALAKGVDVVAASSPGWEDRVLGYVVHAAVLIKTELLKDAAPQKPLVLITVASQDQALQVRSVCKPLKKLSGISSVCVHTGTSLDSQIRGLSLITPEIVVATPERLVELIAVKAISLSSVLFSVIDGLDEIFNKGFQNHLDEIRQYLINASQRVIICDKFSKDTVNNARRLVVDPIERMIFEPNLESRSICVSQEVSFFTSPDKRMPKLLKILQQLKEKQEKSATSTILILVDNIDAVEKLLLAIQRIRPDSVALTKRGQIEQISKKLRQGSLKTLVSTEGFLGQIPLDSIQVVINYGFTSTIKTYEQILTGMARRSLHGECHSLCTASMAPMARDLVVVLQKCLQEVPRSLQMVADAATLVQNGKL